MKIPIYQVDAFTNELFGGNPAAVCILAHELSTSLMQKIAAENNLAETAFVNQFSNGYQIRWFTPTVEVDLCGHATLAAAFVLFTYCNLKTDLIEFNSRSGILKVKKQGEILVLDFPADKIQPALLPNELKTSFESQVLECFKGKTDYLLVFEDEEQIKTLSPKMEEVAKLNARGLIVTAKGKNVDFVSRFFAPQSGINEDPVTGSAHTTLTPYWASRLNKLEFHALQLSQRGGELWCKLNGDRVEIAGKAVNYLVGEIEVEE